MALKTVGLQDRPHRLLEEGGLAGGWRLGPCGESASDREDERQATTHEGGSEGAG
jgi:hypothetical protein